MPTRPFVPHKCYWFIGTDKTRFWSSARQEYVDVNDAGYLAWSAAGNETKTAESELALSRYLDERGGTAADALLPPTWYIGPVVLPKYVNAERDRRIASGFMFADHLFQSDVASQKRIAGAVSLAILAIGSGKQAGDMLWHGGETPFSWLAADNTAVPMDAQTVVLFGKTAGAWEYEHVIAARALKDMAPVPRDFTDDSHWPQKAA